MIHQMMHKDVYDVVELIHDFCLRLYGPEYSRSAAFNEMYGNVRNPDALMLVSKNKKKVGGVFIGHRHKLPFTNTVIMREVLWYSVDNSGLKLLSTAIEWAREYGVDQFYHTMVEPVDDKAIKILQRVGMTPVERSFVMKL